MYVFLRECVSCNVLAHFSMQVGKYICMHVCLYVRIHIHTKDGRWECTLVFRCMYKTYKLIHKHMYVLVSALFINTYTYIHTFIYVYIQIHTIYLYLSICVCIYDVHAMCSIYIYL